MTPSADPSRTTPSRADLRVILVAKLGAAPTLEATLRRDPTIEFIRARDPLDAVGELACPIDVQSPVRTIVLVGPGSLSDPEASDFCAALRRVDGQVRVLALGDVTIRSGSGSFDGSAPLDASVETLRRAMQAASPNGAARGSSEPSARRTVREPASVVAASASGEGGEIAILRAVTTGADVLAPCIAELRRRLGDVEATFQREGGEGANASGVVGAPVEHGGRRFGRLVTRASGPAASDGAAWLAHWLLLQEQQSQLRQAAFTDPLTGLWNRRYFERRLESSLEHARGHRAELSVLLFDIDDFKVFNDRHSHAVGDEILREIASLIRSVVRPSDRVCRIGGDEFAVIFYDPEGPREPSSAPGSSRHALSVAQIAGRFQRRTAERCFPKLGHSAPGALSISGGLATFPWDATDGQGLVELADRRALESKSQGKNTITFGPVTR